MPVPALGPEDTGVNQTHPVLGMETPWSAYLGTSTSEAPADCWLPEAAAGEDAPPRPLAAQPSTGQGGGGGGHCG